MAFFTHLAHTHVGHGGPPVDIGNVVAYVAAIIAALAALVTVALTTRAISVARSTLGEAVIARQEAESDRKAAEADRKQARADRELDRRQRKRDRDLDRLYRIAEMLEQIHGLAWNDSRVNPHLDTWGRSRYLLAAALVGTTGLINCEGVLTVDDPMSAMSAVYTARTEVRDAMAKLAEPISH